MSLIDTILESDKPATEFQPYVYLSPEADAISFYFEGDADYSVRLTDHVTLFKSLATNKTIGCRIKGIRELVLDLPNYLDIDGGDVQLSVIFLSFRGGLADAAAREEVNTLARHAGGLKFQPA